MLLLFCLILIFLPNSIEYGWYISLHGVQLPLFYLAAIASIVVFSRPLFRGIMLLREMSILLAYMVLHGILSGSFLHGEGQLSAIKCVFPMLTVFIAAGAHQRIPSWKKLSRLFAVVLLFIVAYTLLFSFMPEWIGNYIPGWGRLRSSSGIGAARTALPFGGPNLVGCFLALLFPVLFAEVISKRRKSSLSLGNFFLALVPALLTFSRGTYLLLGAQSLLVMLKSPGKARGVLVVMCIGLGLSVTGATASRVFDTEEVDLDIDEHSYSASLRAATYLAMIRHIARDPLGTGLGAHFLRDKSINDDANNNYSITLIEFDDSLVMYQSHSGVLLFLVEHGWLGGILLLWAYRGFLRRLTRARRLAIASQHLYQSQLFHAMRVMLLTFAGWNLISDGLFYNFRFAVLTWSIIGIYLALSLDYTRKVVIARRAQAAIDRDPSRPVLRPIVSPTTTPRAA